MLDVNKFAKEQKWKEINMKLSYLNRFDRDEYTVDFWFSNKKGVTVGIYHEETARYLKNLSEEDIMEILVDPDYLNKINKGNLTTRWRKK